MTPSAKPINPFEPTRIDSLDARSIQWKNQDVAVLTCQIIVGALGMGVLTFAGIVLFQSSVQINLVPTATVYVAVFVAVIAIAMSFAVPALISTLATSRLNGSQEPADETVTKLFSVFQTQLILGCAFLEGAAFLNVFLYQGSKSIFSLVAFAVCTAFLIVRIPTKGKIQAWIAKRLSP